MSVLLLPTMVLASNPPTATVQGTVTSWRLSLLAIRSVDRIPHTSWVGYRGNFYRFFVLTLRMTNAGSVAADPYHDLILTLRVMPPRFTHYAEGFMPMRIDRDVFEDIATTAAQEFGGQPLWVATKPGRSSTYVAVIGTNRGDAHYGLYNFSLRKGYALLFSVGV